MAVLGKKLVKPLDSGEGHLMSNYHDDDDDDGFHDFHFKPDIHF